MHWAEEENQILAQLKEKDTKHFGTNIAIVCLVKNHQ
jgi:hypothetical protein